MKKINIRVVFTENALMKEMGRFRFREADLPSIWEVHKQMQKAVKIEAFYTPYEAENADVNQMAAFVTLGAGVDRLQELYDREKKVFEQYALECISMVYLSHAYQKIFAAVQAEEKLAVGTFSFWEEHHTLEELQTLLAKYPQTGMTCTKEAVMHPQKSVVLVLGLQKEKGKGCAPMEGMQKEMCSRCTHKCGEYK